MDNTFYSNFSSLQTGKDDNKFTILCDNVTSSLLLMHSVVQQVLTFDLQFGKYELPNSVLLNLALVSSKLHRTVSDLTTQVEELIRLVKLFSVSWEENSQAFGKLHQDYNKKQRQMEITLKKLEILSGRNEQLEKYRIFMNWEKMFLKVIGNSHGNLGWRHIVHEYNTNISAGKSVSHLFQNLNREDTFENEINLPNGEPLTKENDANFQKTDELLENGSSISMGELADNEELYSNQSDTDDELKVFSRIESDNIAEWVTSSDVIAENEEIPGGNKDEQIGSANADSVFYETQEEIQSPVSTPLLIQSPLHENKLMIDKSTSTYKYEHVFHLQVFRPTSFSEEDLFVTVGFNKQLQIGNTFRINPADCEASLQRETLEHIDDPRLGDVNNIVIMNLPVQHFLFNIDFCHDSDVCNNEQFRDSKLRITLHAGPNKKVVAACSSVLQDLNIADVLNQNEIENVISHHNNEIKMVPTTDAGLLKLNQTCGQLSVNCYVTHKKRLWNYTDETTDTASITAVPCCRSVATETELKPIYTEDDVLAIQQQFQQRFCDLRTEYEQLMAVSIAPDHTVAIATSPISQLSMGDGRSNHSFQNSPSMPLSPATVRQSARSTKSVIKKWGKDLPPNFFTRLVMFQEASDKYRKQLNNQTKKAAGEVVTKKLQAERKLWEENKKSTFSTDLFLPVVFAPMRGQRAHTHSGRSYVRKGYDLTPTKSGVFPKLESQPISGLSLDAES